MAPGQRARQSEERIRWKMIEEEQQGQLVG